MIDPAQPLLVGALSRVVIKEGCDISVETYLFLQI